MQTEHCSPRTEPTDFTVLFERLDAYAAEQSACGAPSETLDPEELETIRLLSRIVEETASPRAICSDD